MSLIFSLLLCLPLPSTHQVESKGEGEMEEGEKVQEGENERNPEKEQDSEVTADVKSGNR